MRIKIDSGGALHILRGGQWKAQLCPFSSSSDNGRYDRPCGHWCPHFGEPWPDSGCFKTSAAEKEQWLWLCHRRRLEGGITDERGKE